VVEDPSVLEVLQEEEVPLAWLAAGAAAEERPDLPDDIPQWLAAMEAARQRTWQVAETLFYQCKDRADAEKLRFLQEDEYEVAVERIHLSLAGISQSLVSEIPTDRRREGTAVLHIDRSGTEEKEMASAAWEGDGAEARFDLTDVAEQCAQLHGGLSSASADLFARVLVRELFENAITLPAFARGQRTGDTLWLEWKSPARAAKSDIAVNEDARDSARRRVRELRERAEELAEKGKEFVGRQRESVEAAIEAGKHAYREEKRKA
jgi:hypothetical protein